MNECVKLSRLFPKPAVTTIRRLSTPPKNTPPTVRSRNDDSDVHVVASLAEAPVRDAELRESTPNERPTSVTLVPPDATPFVTTWLET